MKLSDLMKQLGIETWLEFASDMLVPEERIRAFCLENRCGNYGNNYMCPPYAGSLQEIRANLGRFERGVLLQYAKHLDVKGDRDGVTETKIDFHNKILRIEEFLRERRVNEIWGMIGGSCGLCGICGAKAGEPCLYPEKARTSLEAIAVDVVALLDRCGLDSKFYADKVTWTGCILFRGISNKQALDDI